MKKFLKAISAMMLMVAVICAAGCTKDPENGGGNDGNGNGSGNSGNSGGQGGGSNNGTELDAGMYLGVIGFNEQLYTMPLARLDASAVTATKRFIDGLQLGGATLLYHAVNTSIDNLSSNGIPKDLVNVSIVTFTDGLDKGSYAYSNYSSGAEYLRAVTQRIRNERVSNVEIQAHTIGIQGTDVYSYDQDEFLNNLNGLSSLPSNKYVHYVTDFSDIQAVFDTIAESLHNQTTNSKLSIKMPVEDPNTRVRFTFDITTSGPNDAASSQHYIDGVYITNSERNGVLTNVQYYGLGSSSGSTVTSTNEGVFAKFMFEGMVDTDNNPFNNSNITHLKEWIYNSNAGSWIHNSEFTSSGNTEITNEYYSSMIMLNLDCSQSLGANQFSTLKDYAKRFVDGLKINQ